MFFIQFLYLIDDFLSMDNLFIGVFRRRGSGVISVLLHKLEFNTLPPTTHTTSQTYTNKKNTTTPKGHRVLSI